MRFKFDEQLEKLNEELTLMGTLCEDVISNATKALLEGKDKYLDNVFRADTEIDRKEREIEALCLKMLLQQQPVAKDLRLISSALKMITDMERIGDQASDIAEIVKYADVTATGSDIHIADMARATIKMVTDSIDAYVRSDLTLAQDVIKYDDIVDDLFTRVKDDLIELISRDAAMGQYSLDLLMIAKYYERIGDHAVNVAEWVDFSITGLHRDSKQQFLDS